MGAIKRDFLRFGIKADRKEREYLRKELENRNLALPSEIFSEGIADPPKTDAEHSEVERRLRLIAEAIPKIKLSIPTWPKVFQWEALLNGGLRYPSASAGAIQAAEQRLGVDFPSSYRNFLMVSNGWLTDQEIFLPVERIGRSQDKRLYQKVV